MLLFISLITIACVNAATTPGFNLPHGNDLKHMVDQGFTLFDKNKDGQITIDEMVYFNDQDDLNHDGNLTLAEYMQYYNIPIEFAKPIFDVYDWDKDGLIPLGHPQAYFHQIDANDNGSLSLHEYEHFMTGFYECVFGHGSHGHGADCAHR